VTDSSTLSTDDRSIKERHVRENTLRKIWARGEAVVNGWLSIPSSFSAEIMIAAGYQFVTLASESRFMAAKAAEEVSAVRKTGVKAGTLPAY
jgi:2-keto-3-deoxy-L-rhamnonate aldolase RhmA